MAYSDLILRGQLCIASSELSISATDVSDEVTGLIIKSLTTDVVIPATMATGVVRHAAGAKKYQVQIDYLADDSSTTSTLFGILWQVVTGQSKAVQATALLHSGSESPANPLWTFEFIVDQLDLGGKAEDLSTGSFTATLTGAPTILES